MTRVLPSRPPHAVALPAALTAVLATAVTAVLAAAVAAPGVAAAAPVSAERYGLYGTQDPTYDGAFRQGLAVLALQAAGRPTPGAAVGWLRRQQCEDGGWTPYRKDLGRPCRTAAEDSNSTAMAVQALAAVGGADAPVGDGLSWLADQQNGDGGVGFVPGSRTDANSTALYVQALRTAGQDPAQATAASGRSALDALLGLQIGCTAAGADEGDGTGGFAFQAGKRQVANDLASASALLALAGQPLPVTSAGRLHARPLPCPATGTPAPAAAARGAAAYVDAQLQAHGGHVPAPQGGKPDWGTTATAVTGLASLGDTEGAERAMKALADGARDYVRDPSGADLPASLATIVLAAVATGQDPEKVAGGAVSRLTDTGPGGSPGGGTARPTDVPSATPLPAGGRDTSAGSDGASSDGGRSDSAGSVVGYAAVAVLVVVAILVVVGLARRREEPR